MSPLSEFARWRLEIQVESLGRGRTVTIDYLSRATLDAQLAQIARRDVNPFPGRLLEFTNEAGETLAIVATSYAAHTVLEL